MKVTECLNTEHGVFLIQLGVLERMLTEKATPEELRAATLIVAEAVEKHRDVEEAIFYPAILQAFGEDFPPIQVMETEHKEIESLIQGISSESDSMPTLVRSFIDILRLHIGKEINVLFPMAEEKISGCRRAHITSSCFPMTAPPVRKARVTGHCAFIR